MFNAQTENSNFSTNRPNTIGMGKSEFNRFKKSAYIYEFLRIKNGKLGILNLWFTDDSTTAVRP